MDDELVCVKIFKKPNSICELCGYKPLKWNFVLYNKNENKSMNVGSNCVVNIKRIIDKHNKDFKIGFFPKHSKAVSIFNEKLDNVAKIIDFKYTPQKIRQILDDPNKIDFFTIKSILNYTSNFDSGIEYNLFHDALDIFIKNEYYLYDKHGKKEYSETIEDIMEDYNKPYEGYIPFDDCLQEDWSAGFDDYESDYWESEDYSDDKE